jgi:hypothetical protein
MKWLLRLPLLLVAAYFSFCGVVVGAMVQPPERFGAFMRHMPPAVIWGALPAERMWLWARAGSLQPGDPAPDFTLPTNDHRAQITLSSNRGKRPVVLVFGSYT